jgi:hypothetical protein
LQNFAKYQDFTESCDYEESRQRTGREQASNNQTTTYKNVNNDNNDKNVEVCIANIDLLKEKYPDIDWDSYDEEDYLVGPTRYKSGKGVVYLSTVQEELLLEKIDNPHTFNEYLGKLADFIINKDARVKNHYMTILKWYSEDGRI